MRAGLLSAGLPDGAGGAVGDRVSDRLHAAGCVPLPSHDRRAHRYLDPARLYYAGLAEHPELREVLRFWIEGQPGEWSRDLNPLLRRQVPGPRLLALPDYRTFGHVYAYLLGGLSCLCRELGYAGLALLVDEAEFYAALCAEDRAFAETVFGCWALACLSDEQARQGEAALRKGGQEVHRRLPLRHRPDQPLACCFFLTPDPQGLAALDTWVDLARHQVELAPLEPAHYGELYERVLGIYGAAHPGFEVPAGVTDAMGRMLYGALHCGALANPRAVLKLLVEVLDVCRLCSHRLPGLMGDLSRVIAGEG